MQEQTAAGRAAHTPGPSTANGWNLSEPTIKGGEIHYDIHTTTRRICSIHFRADHPTEGNTVVSLFMAAPDLLAVASDCLHQLSTDSDLDAVTAPQKYQRLVDMLRAAIAKAEGGEA